MKMVNETIVGVPLRSRNYPTRSVLARAERIGNDTYNLNISAYHQAARELHLNPSDKKALVVMTLKHNDPIVVHVIDNAGVNLFDLYRIRRRAI